MENIFKKEILQINAKLSIHMISIKSMNQKLHDFLDKAFVRICEGDSGSSINDAKIVVKRYFETQSENIIMGAVAEFFIHLYLYQNDFKQECLFLNLEENSIKKGFDGYYSKDEAEWIMESKSGSILTNDDNNHYDMLKKAYNDLKNKLAGTNGKNKNNPWKNAYNHASHIDVNSKQSLRQHLKALSNDYDKKLYYDIKDFNIIPSSTIFLVNTWVDQDSFSIRNKLDTYFKDKNYKEIILLCITKISINILIDYIREI